MAEPVALSVIATAGRPAAPNRSAVIGELRRLLRPLKQACGQSLPFGVTALDAHLPEGGLDGGGLHEIVPATESAIAAAFGFMVAILARLEPAHPLVFVIPVRGRQPGRYFGRLFGHGLNSLGLDPTRLVLVETAHRKETLWAMAEALHSGAAAAVAGMIDRLDLKTSQKLQLAASDCGLPLWLLRPAPMLETSAAATRWRVGTAKAVRDRFDLYMNPRWHLQLERCRNGRPGEWVVEYDHVAHRFSLVAALADSALSCSARDQPADDRILQIG
jgi:protein ImuA